jgi:thiol-disulfide isomerase/thioredoxin
MAEESIPLRRPSTGARVLNRSAPSLMMRVALSLFLILAALFWNPVVVVEAQEDSVHENGQESKTDDLDPPLNESFLQKENGIIVLESLNSLSQVFQQEESLLVLTLVHSSSCPHSLALLNRVEEAHRMLTDHFETTSDAVADQKMPSLAKLDAIDSDPVDLQKSGVFAFPTLVFATGDSSGHTPFLLEYTGRQETAEDIYRTVLHYFHQLIVAAGDVHHTDDFLNVKPREFHSMMDVTDFMRDQRHGILGNTVVEPGFPSTISAELQEYISWLMFDEVADDFVLIVQCRNRQSEESRPYYKSFDHMVLVVSSRRDRLFITLSDCDAVDGSVVAWKIPLNIDLSGERELSVPKATFSPSPRTDQLSSDDLSLELIEFVVKVSTPSLLWFDRQATAPIAFPKYRQVHVVLFVDLHHVEEGLDRPSAVKSRDMIRRFRHTCREHWRNDDTAEHDMVCLVVPSTETRILTTFGIDIWSVLDERVRHPEVKEWTEPLPSLMLTDQRSGGTKRYYLDSVALSASNEAIQDFVSSFWQGQLTPQAKSSTGGPLTNASGVRIVTGDSFKSEILQADDDRHALIFFSAPTCGHCKRFSILWNQLAELIAHIEWDAFLTLYQMDVTTDEILDLDIISVRWLPDVYYFSPHDRTHPVRYDVTDEQGEGVGRLGSPVEILHWLIQEGDFEDAQLRQLLLGLNKKDETTAK